MKIFLSLFLTIFLISFISAVQFDQMNCYNNQTAGTCEQILCDNIASGSDLSGLLIDANARLSANVTYYKNELISCEKSESAKNALLITFAALLALLSFRYFKLANGK